MRKIGADTQRTAREGIESFRQMFEKNQKLSIKYASGRLNIPTTTDHRVLHKILKKKPYHIQKLHDFREEDYPRRTAMCAEFVDQIPNENLMDHLFQ